MGLHRTLDLEALMGAQNNVRREVVACLRPTMCSWCVRLRSTLYRYSGMPGWFCSAPCWRAYHDISRADYDYIEFTERR